MRNPRLLDGSELPSIQQASSSRTKLDVDEAAHLEVLVLVDEVVDEAVKEDEVTLKVVQVRTEDQDVVMIGDQGGTMMEGVVVVVEDHLDGDVTMHLTSKTKRTSHHWEHHEIGWSYLCLKNSACFTALWYLRELKTKQCNFILVVIINACTILVSVVSLLYHYWCCLLFLYLCLLMFSTT